VPARFSERHNIFRETHRRFAVFLYICSRKISRTQPYIVPSHFRDYPELLDYQDENQIKLQ